LDLAGGNKRSGKWRLNREIPSKKNFKEKIPLDREFAKDRTLHRKSVPRE